MKFDPLVARRNPSRAGAGAPNGTTPLGRPSGGPERITPLQIEHVPIGQLRLDAPNPRLHPERQIKQIARSIDTFGFNVPVLADREGYLLCAHGRVRAARRLGLRTVPVIRLE